jgi:hypothetical protein
MNLASSDGDRRHVSAWSDLELRAGFHAIKLGGGREAQLMRVSRRSYIRNHPLSGALQSVGGIQGTYVPGGHS